MDVTLDLGRLQPVHYVTATFLASPSAWVFLPDRVTVEWSSDGKTFHMAGTILNENPDGLYIPFGITVGHDARYIRYHASRTKEWLFVDEIQVY